MKQWGKSGLRTCAVDERSRFDVYIRFLMGGVRFLGVPAGHIIQGHPPMSPVFFGAVEKAVNLRGVEHGGKKRETEPAEIGDVNSGAKVFDIFAVAMDPKVGERREDGARFWRPRLDGFARSTTLESESEFFEMGKCGQEIG